MIVKRIITMIQKQYVTNKAFLCPCHLQYNIILKTQQYLCILYKPYTPSQLIIPGETKRGKKKAKERMAEIAQNLSIIVNILN